MYWECESYVTAEAVFYCLYTKSSIRESSTSPSFNAVCFSRDFNILRYLA